MDRIPDIEKLLDSSFKCACGIEHFGPTKKIIYSEDALNKLPRVLRSYGLGETAVVLADERTYEIAARGAQKILKASGWQVSSVVMPDRGDKRPVCDDVTFERLRSDLPNGDVFVAVGSGVVNDLTKWLAFDKGVPYVVVATAATMNGYTAANVAPMIKGVKSLIRAKAATAVLAVGNIIANAPFELTAAGFGDSVAKEISTADWLMNHILFDEYYCSWCGGLVLRFGDNALVPEDIKACKPDAIEAVFRTLLYSGITMTLVGTSAPASGGEHLLSHTLDMMAEVDGKSHDLHGRQVGIGTIFAAALYEKLLEIEVPKTVEPPKNIDIKFWGPLAGAIAQEYQSKQEKLKTMKKAFADIDQWNRFKAALSDKLKPAHLIKDYLRRAGAAHCIDDIGCSKSRVLEAIMHMHEIRSRCTVVDLAWVMGVLPQAGEEIAEELLL